MSVRLPRWGLLVGVVVLVGLLVGVSSVFAQTTPDFEDVPDGHIAESAIEWAAENGITQGVGGNRFGMGQTLIRYEMVTFLCRAFSPGNCQSGMKGSDRFDDVPEGHWANYSVGWAANQQITSGVSDTEFGGSKTLIREQMITFLYRAKGKPTGGSLGSDIYQDVPDDHSQWANLPIGWAFDQGISAGIGEGTFGFGTNLSREEMVLFLCRTLDPDTCQPSQQPLTSSVVPTTTTPQSQGQANEPPEGANLHPGNGFYCWVYGTGPFGISCSGEGQPFGTAGGPEGLFSSLAVGSDYVCALRYANKSYAGSDTQDGVFTITALVPWVPRWPGVVDCWGDAPQPIPAGDFTTVAAGADHVCAVRDDIGADGRPAGPLVCWGDSAYGQADPPAGRFVTVAAGAIHSCAIKDTSNIVDSIACWGDEYSQLDVPWGIFDTIYSRWDVYRTCARDSGTWLWRCWPALDD